MPESLLIMISTALLGWGTFTWRRAEDALHVARRSIDATDRLEVKVAENYVTKEDLKDSIETIMHEFTRTREDISTGFSLIRGSHKEATYQTNEAIHRLEDKVEHYVSEQAQRNRDYRSRIEKYDLDS